MAHSQAQDELISVLIPCYNYADWVGQALESVLKQDYPLFELIVVNDGSQDDSLAVINKTLSDAPRSQGLIRVEVVDQANAGVSAALNAGLALAQGSLIATFDADDVMPQGRLRLMADFMSEHPEVVCVGGRTQRIGADGVLEELRQRKWRIRFFDFAQVLRNIVVVGGNVAMFRHSAALSVGSYDPSITVQDFQMTLRLAHAGGLIAMLPEVVTLYRRHAGSLSMNFRHEYKQGLAAIAPYRNHPAYPQAKANLAIKAMRSAVHLDRALAWKLMTSVPIKYWNRTFFRRVRQLLVNRIRS